MTRYLPSPRGVLSVLALVCAGSAAAQESSRPASGADILVSVGRDTIAAPDTVRPGWNRLRVEEADAGHIVVVFRLSPTSSSGEVKAFLAALDSSPATPRSGVAMGGPEVGEVGEVIVKLLPGRYLLACVRAGSDGHRHANAGEAKVLVVRKGGADAAHASPPRFTQRVRMLDFAYQGGETWTAGPQIIRVENAGRQDHQLRIVQLKAGSTMSDWMTAARPGQHGKAVVGIARMGPGEVAYLPVDLPAGTYVAHCLVTDPATGRQHIQMGMLRSITIK